MVCCSPIPATCRTGHQRIALSSASSMQSRTGYSSSLDFVPDFFLNSSFLTLNFLFLTSDFLTGSAESESKSPDRLAASRLPVATEGVVVSFAVRALALRPSVFARRAIHSNRASMHQRIRPRIQQVNCISESYPPSLARACMFELFGCEAPRMG